MKVIRGSEIEFVPASHENPDDPGVLKRVLATKDDLLHGQVQMVNWSMLPVGKSFQRHYHEDMQEVFVILNGQVQMQIDSTSVDLNEGDAILISPGEIHEMANVCKENVQYVVFGISTEKDGKTVIVDD